MKDEGLREKAPYTIEFRPVCSVCNQEIIGIIDYNVYDIDIDNARRLDRLGVIEPMECPHCGVKFERITIPKRLPYDNRKELSKS